ncbi:MAG: aminotransferase class V-fold PLP-dependent enzyme [candidate division WOR-3 bacterium]|jgi:selenocysteine lyase/cysteine desulfurase|nr:aminotransferase class V-fold PLP-dependent enzyme [candidate division WOR-3 bacterium]MDH7518609.1 aminotransferase class V-fold PLP-dependent enzyme [bacterium]
MVTGEVNRIRELFPVVNRWIYLNHAGTGPLPIPVVRSIAKFCEKASEQGSVSYQEAEGVVEKTRRMAARLMGVKQTEVAFVKNTSSGIIIAIGSIPWERDDNMIMMKDAFPSNFYPYHLLLPEIEKRFVTAAELIQGPECVFRLVDEHTRAIALDWVHFLSGARFDVETIGRFCQERQIYFIVDAIQGLGAVATDISKFNADFVVAGGGKWLLAPQGIGVLYVNSRVLPRLKPFNLGWLSCEWLEFNDCFNPKPLKKGARRFEEGTKNYLGIYGLQEALKILLDFGIDNVNSRINRLVEQLRTRMQGLGFEILTPENVNQRAGILTCRRDGTSMMELQKRLEEQKIIVSVRENCLRISPHFYNTEAEIEQFAEHVKLFG